MGLSYLGDWLSEKGKEKTRQKPRKEELGGGVPVYHRAALPQLLERCWKDSTIIFWTCNDNVFFVLELCSALVYDKGNEGWGRIPKTGTRLIEVRNKENLGASRTFACLTVITTRGVSLSMLGKDEVASSNLASSSKASEIFGFQRFSFAVVKIQLQKVQNRQFCENH